MDSACILFSVYKHIYSLAMLSSQVICMGMIEASSHPYKEILLRDFDS